MTIHLDERFEPDVVEAVLNLSIDDEVALLEAAGMGAEKYFTHSNAHAMAFSKYAAEAKACRETGNAARARLLNRIGKKHKAAAEALAAIAGHHVDALHSKQMGKTRMKTAVNVNEVEINEDIDPGMGLSEVAVMIGHAIERKPLEFQRAFDEILQARVAAAIEDIRVSVAQDFGGTAEPIAEGEEPIDELSTGTLGRYVKRSLNDVRNSNQAIGRRDKGDPFRNVRKEAGDEQGDYHDENKRKARNREKGVRTAFDKIAKRHGEAAD